MYVCISVTLYLRGRGFCGLVPRLLATWYWFEPAPVPTDESNGDPVEGTAESRRDVEPAPVPTDESSGDPVEVSAESRSEPGTMTNASDLNLSYITLLIADLPSNTEISLTLSGSTQDSATYSA